MLSTQSIVDLDRRFGIAGVAAVVVGNGGFPKVVITSPYARGENYLHGGHVTSWIPNGAKEVFYCSPNTLWKDGRAIRGGVPLCFPWFGDKADDRSAPSHGFVRTKAWELEAIERAGDGIAVSVSTKSSDGTRKWWPHEFRLVCRATFGVALKLELTVSNTDAVPFSFEEALHAYFRVGDAVSATVQGLDGTRYIDKVDHFAEKPQAGDIHLTGETDRVYLSTSHDVEIVDPMLNRRLLIHKENSRNTVVWNPWAEKSSTLADLGPGEWKNFICVETANVGSSAVQLVPGPSHTMTMEVRLG